MTSTQVKLKNLLHGLGKPLITNVWNDFNVISHSHRRENRMLADGGVKKIGRDFMSKSVNLKYEYVSIINDI